MKKYKELIKNIGFLVISNFGSKLLTFFLVPLYTAVLTTEEYGKFDFITITISLLIPILSLNISEGALRYLLDKTKNKKDVCNISLRLTIYSLFILAILIIINSLFNVVGIINDYIIYFILFYIASLFYTYMQNITRGLDKLKNIAISGLINSLLMLVLNIYFLLVLKIGLSGYFLAYILSNLISSIYLAISINIKKYISNDKTDIELRKDMVNYSKPLMLNSIGWWINNVSDRYIVTYMCGLAANGIYSMAYKIPSLLSIVQTIFNQAWSISAIKNIDDKSEVKFFKNTYCVYNFLIVISCSILIILTKVLAKILYLNDFYSSWKYMPVLMISIVFSSLSGMLGGIFSAVKDTKTMGRTTLYGALINIVLNIILIKIIGVMGAAISTAFSCYIVWFLRMKKLKKYINLNINIKKDMIVYMLLIVQCILFFVTNNYLLLYSLEFIILLLMILVYKSYIKIGILKFKGKVSKIGKN